MEVNSSILKNRTVVMADDDDFMRGMLRNILSAHGLRILDEANDGAKAVQLFQKLQPQIMCLDIEMPNMTGLEALVKIREQSSNVIVMMISAATTGDNVRTAVAARANGIISKPFSASKIISELERAVAKAEGVKKS